MGLYDLESDIFYSIKNMKKENTVLATVSFEEQYFF